MATPVSELMKAKSVDTIVQEYLDFNNGSPTQFHCTEQAVNRFKAGGYVQLSEKDQNWKKLIVPGGKYFFTRNQSSVVAFAVGKKWKSGNGYIIAGAHTDSPVLKVKPVSNTTKAGFDQLGVELYGGGIWHSWFDRDLSVAGRAIVKKGDEYHAMLVRLNKPICKIPTLAIHLDRGVNTDGFKFNLETQLLPILSTHNKAEEVKDADDDIFQKEHHPILIQMVADELKVNCKDIVNFELCLYDIQPSQVGGIKDEFIFSRALDNQMMSFLCTQALIDITKNDKNLDECDQIWVTALFDNEEVGSDSLMGAGSNMLEKMIKRIEDNTESHDAAIANSILLSADMAHAYHPNYTEKHENNHKPEIHKGLVIKHNGNQRYATNITSSLALFEIAKKYNITTQKFCVRNDSACGSTIGPIMSTSLGVRTVDVGVPQWSMHSIRETCGTKDVHLAYQLLLGTFADFRAFDLKLFVDEPKK